MIQNKYQQERMKDAYAGKGNWKGEEVVNENWKSGGRLSIAELCRKKNRTSRGDDKSTQEGSLVFYRFSLYTSVIEHNQKKYPLALMTQRHKSRNERTHSQITVSIVQLFNFIFLIDPFIPPSSTYPTILFPSRPRSPPSTHSSRPEGN